VSLEPMYRKGSFTVRISIKSSSGFCLAWGGGSPHPMSKHNDPMANRWSAGHFIEYLLWNMV
ncbi:MAG: hypothetical protein ACO3OK_13170, partial [Limisphaerales bacterium]